MGRYNSFFRPRSLSFKPPAYGSGRRTRTMRRGYTGKSFSRTRTKNKKAIEPPPVTGQFDYKTDYVRKRMPRRRRKRWLRFRRKVQYINDKGLGLKSHIVSFEQKLTTTAITSNAFGEELFSCDGKSNHKDLGDIARNALGAAFNNQQITAAGPSHSKSIHFESANMEVSIHNTGLNTVVLEVYHVRCRKDGLQFSDGSFNEMLGYYRQGFLKTEQIEDPDTGTILPGASLIAFDTPGTTPFQCPMFCSYFQVLKREKFTIPVGGLIQKSLRIPKNRWLNIDNLRSKNVLRGWTEGFLFQFQGVPQDEFGVPEPASPTTLNIFTVRRYSYYSRASGFDQGQVAAP